MNDYKKGIFEATDLMIKFEEDGLNLVDSYSGALTALLFGVMNKCQQNNRIAHEVILKCTSKASKLHAALQKASKETANEKPSRK
jgi:hypothetical protein